MAACLSSVMADTQAAWELAQLEIRFGSNATKFITAAGCAEPIPIQTSARRRGARRVRAARERPASHAASGLQRGAAGGQHDQRQHDVRFRLALLAYCFQQRWCGRRGRRSLSEQQSRHAKQAGERQHHPAGAVQHHYIPFSVPITRPSGQCRTGTRRYSAFLGNRVIPDCCRRVYRVVKARRQLVTVGNRTAGDSLRAEGGGLASASDRRPLV